LYKSLGLYDHPVWKNTFFAYITFSVVYLLKEHRILIAGKKMVKVKFSLEQAMKAQRGSRGIALLFL
jgi:hypothetical protein